VRACKQGSARGGWQAMAETAGYGQPLVGPRPPTAMGLFQLPARTLPSAKGKPKPPFFLGASSLGASLAAGAGALAGAAREKREPNGEAGRGGSSSSSSSSTGALAAGLRVNREPKGDVGLAGAASSSSSSSSSTEAALAWRGSGARAWGGLLLADEWQGHAALQDREPHCGRLTRQRCSCR
jgi:hypothetical protein